MSNEQCLSISAMDIDWLMIQHFGPDHESRKMEAINAAIARGEVVVDGKQVTEPLEVVSTYRDGYEDYLKNPIAKINGGS